MMVLDEVAREPREVVEGTGGRDAQPGMPKMTTFLPFQSLCVLILDLQGVRVRMA